MKSIKRIFFLLSFISVSYLSTFAQENQSYFLHTIEKGQSLYSISSMYGVSKADIIRLNPGCEDKIYAGQAIKIPQNKTAQKGETFHTIQPGETLYRLTTTYKVSAKAICDANPGLSAENFRIGQVIRIPSAAEAIDSTVEAVVAAPSEPAMQPAVKPRCKDMHKVKRRETIFSVSREYGISEQELIAANPELKNGMKKGQFLCIPYPSEKPTVTVPKTDANIIPPSDSELFRENKEVPKSISTIKAALLLPFDDKRMVEYYEGFLMAVDSLKRTGTSIDLYVYDWNKGKFVAEQHSGQKRDEKYECDLRSGATTTHQTIGSLCQEKRYTPGHSFFLKRGRSIQQPVYLPDQYSAILSVFGSIRALYTPISKRQRDSSGISGCR